MGRFSGPPRRGERFHKGWESKSGRRMISSDSDHKGWESESRRSWMISSDSDHKGWESESGRRRMISSDLDHRGWESESGRRMISSDLDPTNILDVTIHNAVYAITTDVLYRVVARVTKVIRIVIRQRLVENVTLKVKAYVEVSSAKSALSVINLLNGANVYDNCCTLEFAFAPQQLSPLNVIKNDDDMWDYTKSLLQIPVYECVTSPETEEGTSSAGRKRRYHSNSSHDSSHPPKKYRIATENTEELDPWPGYQAAGGFEPFQESYSPGLQSDYAPEYVPIGQSQVALPGLLSTTASTADAEAQSSALLPPSGYVDLDAPTETGPWRGDQREEGHRQIPEPRRNRFGDDGYQSQTTLGGRWNRPRSQAFAESDFSSFNNNNYNIPSSRIATKSSGHLESATNYQGRVLIVHNLPELMDPAKVFNLLGVYGDVIRIKFLINYKGTALVEMSDSDAAWRVIEHLNEIVVLGNQLLIRMSNQEAIYSSRYKKLLANGAESYFDFSGSKLHRFTGSKDAFKNRIVTPGNVVHFFNLTKEVDLPDKLREVLFGCHIPAPPVTIQFTRPISQQPVNSGHLEFSSVDDSVAALVLANNTMINPVNGRGRVLKLCFSDHTPPFTNIGV